MPVMGSVQKKFKKNCKLFGKNIGIFLKSKIRYNVFNIIKRAIMKHKGFSLLELLVTLVIIGVVVGVASIPLLQFLSKQKLQQSAIVVGQVIQEAQNYARSRSTQSRVVFSDTTATIEVKNPELTFSEVSQIQLDDNIAYDSTNSGLSNSTLYFSFKGAPLTDQTAEESDFTVQDGIIALCYYTGNPTNCNRTMTIQVTPLTGIVTAE
jgi:prepilin-type N-terminal cleavage/methylation domain-containing protein